MLHINTTPAQRREKFRASLKTGRLQRFAGAYSPLVGKLLEEQGYDGIYIAGASLAADLALPDIALTTLTEVSQRGYQIARATNLPTIIDVDTGFGEPQSVYRTAREIESLGMCCMHIEDQEEPKRCGHLDNKRITSVESMVRRLRAALDARIDANFMVMARTDARAVEGLDAAIARGKAYVDAGAEAIFAEAMHNAREFEAFRRAVDVPILANMTAFGQSELLTVDELQNAGVNIVIYPNEAFRFAMKAVEEYMGELLRAGTQKHLTDKLQHRGRLYELLDYAQYNRFDPTLFDFEVPTGDGVTPGQARHNTTGAK
jgi:methylisocitrate lyase